MRGIPWVRISLEIRGLQARNPLIFLLFGGIIISGKVLIILLRSFQSNALEMAFQRLFQAKGINAGLDLAVRAGERFRKGSLDYIRLYDGAVELLSALGANGQDVWLLSNAQRIFTAYELCTLGIETLFDGIYLSSDSG